MLDRHKKWIDEASYEDMLRKVRFAEIGNPFFHGETGEYYLSVMKEKEKLLAPGERVTISKRIGWDI